MAFKAFQVEGLGEVTVYKRRGARTMRLSVQPNGAVRVTIPAWIPYATGLNFAHSRREWVQSHQMPVPSVLVSGQHIGKAHTLRFASGPALKTRVLPTEVVVTFPPTLEPIDPTVQQKAHQAALRALKGEAEHLLPQRLQLLAAQHGLSYRSVNVRRLKSRWGSCDQHTNIVLNIFLIQLPWHLIDYVLLHELTHTRILQHGPRFWAAMSELDANTPALRKQMREHQPVLAAGI